MKFRISLDDYMIVEGKKKKQNFFLIKCQYYKQVLEIGLSNPRENLIEDPKRRA